MNELKIFENKDFGQVRILEKDGEPWFVAKNISDTLGYDQTSNMIKRLDEEDFISSKLDGMNMKSILINESGLYTAILGSQLPTAKKFKHWVTAEVLPSIRKTGAYKIPLSKKEEMKLYLGALEEQDAKIEAVNKDLQDFKLELPLLGIECDKVTLAVKSRGINCMGGKEAAAYQDKSLRGKVYSDLYGQLKREFAVASYKAIKRNQVDLAIGIIKDYKTPFALSNEIDQCNKQMNIAGESYVSA